MPNRLDQFQNIVRVAWRIGGYRIYIQAEINDLPPPLISYGYSFSGMSPEPLSNKPWNVGIGGAEHGRILEYPLNFASPLIFTLNATWSFAAPGRMIILIREFQGENEFEPNITGSGFGTTWNEDASGMTVHVTFDRELKDVSYSYTTEWVE